MWSWWFWVIFGVCVLPVWFLGLATTIRVADFTSENKRGLKYEARGPLVFFGLGLWPIMLPVVAAFAFAELWSAHETPDSWLWRYMHPKAVRADRQLEEKRLLTEGAREMATLAKRLEDPEEKRLLVDAAKDMVKRAEAI